MAAQLVKEKDNEMVEMVGLQQSIPGVW